MWICTSVLPSNPVHSILLHSALFSITDSPRSTPLYSLRPLLLPNHSLFPITDRYDRRVFRRQRTPPLCLTCFNLRSKSSFLPRYFWVCCSNCAYIPTPSETDLRRRVVCSHLFATPSGRAMRQWRNYYHRCTKTKSVEGHIRWVFSCQGKRTRTKAKTVSTVFDRCRWQWYAAAVAQ